MERRVNPESEESLCQVYMGQGVITRIQKEPRESNIKTSCLVSKWANELSGQSSKEEAQRADEYLKVFNISIHQGDAN